MTAAEIKQLIFDIRTIEDRISEIESRLYYPGANSYDQIVSKTRKSKKSFADSIAKLDQLREDQDRKKETLNMIIDPMPLCPERGLIQDFVSDRTIEDLTKVYRYGCPSKAAKRKRLDLELDIACEMAAAWYEKGYTKDVLIQRIDQANWCINTVKECIAIGSATTENLIYFTNRLERYTKLLNEI